MSRIWSVNNWDLVSERKNVMRVISTAAVVIARLADVTVEISRREDIPNMCSEKTSVRGGKWGGDGSECRSETRDVDENFHQVFPPTHRCRI